VSNSWAACGSSRQLLFEAFNSKAGIGLPDHDPDLPPTENYYWLPVLQAEFAPTPGWISATLHADAGPARLSLNPHFSMDCTGTTSGPATIKPAMHCNHDLMFSFHNNEVGLFSVSAFFKAITDFSYFTQYRSTRRLLRGSNVDTYLEVVAPLSAQTSRTSTARTGQSSEVRGRLSTPVLYLPPQRVVFGDHARIEAPIRGGTASVPESQPAAASYQVVDSAVRTAHQPAR
jgi:hypothetical protein